MGVLEKLDELISKLDDPAEEPAEVEEAETDAPEEETAEQVETPEDVPADETSEKLAQIVIKQQEQIASLNSQIAALVKGGAQVSDGKKTEVANPPSAIPDEYVYLKDMDFSMNEREMI